MTDSTLPSEHPVIIHQAADWLAVAKPAGLSTHNEPGADLMSVVSRALGLPPYLHPVNRLDRGTSGLVILALSSDAAARLGQLFAGRQITKEYLALARLQTRKVPRPGDHGIWSKPLTPEAASRVSPAGPAADRVPAETSWEVLEVAGKVVTLRLSPRTGRKHQLRRHAALHGWPLLGDARYARGVVTKTFHAGRLGLHAWRLHFVDPLNDVEVRLEAPIPSVLARG